MIFNKNGVGHHEQNESRIDYFWCADFEPDYLEAVVGLAPDKMCRIGETIGRSIRKHDYNTWVSSTGYLQCISLTKCLVPLLERLEPFREKLGLAIPPSAELQLSVAIYIHDAVPELNLEKIVISKLAAFGASLDVDVILV